MNEAALAVPAQRSWRHPVFFVGALAILAGFLTVQALGQRLPSSLWRAALLSPDLSDMRQVVVHYSFLPRLAASLLCGAALALAGAILQQVLRNPLAEPTTLGVSAGAQLALVVAAIWAPDLLAHGREGVAILGGSVTTLIVFALAWNKALAPLSVVLSGLIVSLYCGSLATAFVLFQQEALVNLFIWGGGSLSQQDWSAVTYLAPRFAGAAVLVALMARPLTLFGLEEEGARSLGLSLHGARLAALVLAVALSASVVSAVGVIGFIGLAAPALARLAGARRVRDQLVWAPLTGAALLWLTDQIVQRLAGAYGELVPTGAITALFGAPLLLALLPRLRAQGEMPRLGDGAVPARRRRPWRLVALLAGLLVLLTACAMAYGRGVEGWHWSGLDELAALASWRGPRIAGAILAGAMLAVAGALLQRLTGNPMASPEVLGISAGAAFGLVILIVIAPGGGPALQTAAASLGALAALGAIVLLGRKAAFAPTRILLAGIAISAGVQAIVTLLMASGDLRMSMLLSWMAGSTYRIGPGDALTAALVAAFMAVVVPLCTRWLDILPLGDGTGRSLGLDLTRSRFAILLLTAVLTAGATLLVGPLIFVGLMAPHLARLSGLQRPLAQIAGAALIGALVMVAADWLGRNALFPRQVPAGLFATLIGGPYLLWLLKRR